MDIDRERLAKRMIFYLDSNNTDEEVKREVPVAMKDAARFNAIDTRRVLLQVEANAYEQALRTHPQLTAEQLTSQLVDSRIKRYCYRPFDLRWIYWEMHTKLLDEKREDYVRARVEGGPVMLSAQANRRAFDPPCITRSLASLHVDERTALVVPLQALLPTLFHSNVLHQNVSAAVQDSYPEEGQQTNLFFHALAIMHTPQYRTENSGALLGDWPRIPLPSTAELLTHSAALGRRLADLLDPESDLHLAAEWSFLARLSIADEYPEGTPDRDARNAARFALTAGWGGAGQGATVMPRRGDARERDYTSTELDRVATLAATQSLTIDDALSLLGPRCVDVYLNGASSWVCVPLRVWEYTLGGYQVLKKWLSYRELSLLGRPLHEDEARYFAQVVRRIAAILLMGTALDASYSAILPTATGLPSS